MDNRKRIFNIEKDKLAELYKDHSTQGIADICDVSAEIVRRRLHEYGIKVRKNTPDRTFNPTKIELEGLYQKHSMKQIANIYGVGETVIWKRLKEHNIKLDGYENGGHRKKTGREFTQAHRENLRKSQEGKWVNEKNPNWKGGVHQENLKARQTGAYKQWRINALDRAGDKCESCGAKQGFTCECCGHRIRLHVHHVKSFAKYPDLRYEPSNSEVLCPKCHHSRHYGKTG